MLTPLQLVNIPPPMSATKIDFDEAVAFFSHASWCNDLLVYTTDGDFNLLKYSPNRSTQMHSPTKSMTLKYLLLSLMMLERVLRN